MKKILGLDLGTTSIGWAYINEAEKEKETSSIEKLGVRIISFDNFVSTSSGKEAKDPVKDFQSGKGISPNAGRTMSRSARRNLQRYKLRRENLIQLLQKNNWIDSSSILAENGNQSTFETYSLRSKAVTSEVSLNEFARILLMINKKRGYKSSRKVNNTDDGQLIDGMEIAKKLYNENITPGQFVYTILKEGKKKVPDFYRSDLQNELNQIWDFQRKFYADFFTDKLKEEILGKGKVPTWAILKNPFNLVGIKRDKKRDELKIENYQWRNDALSKQLDLEQVAIVLQEINGQLSNSSGYLGAISDRSKELYFNKITVGQYLHNQLFDNPHTRLKNQVFYRQDYLDEFETLWETQAKFHKELTDSLKAEIRDVVIFYQRKLKSQKGLVSICEFEQREIIVDGKGKLVGLKVVPKSSPLFQEFKIWQQLYNVKIKNKETKEVFILNQDQIEILFENLNIKGNLSATEVLKLIENKPKSWELNYTQLEGNRTNQALYNAYLDILDIEGYDVRNELKINLNKDEITLSDLDVSIQEIKDMVSSIFKSLNIDTAILEFNAELEGKDFENQKAYQLWHLLYAYEEDDSKSGMERLYSQLQSKFGFNLDQAKIVGNIVFQDDYGSLSTKAIRKIHPFIKENGYSEACELAGYRHSKNSLTKEELENRILKDRLAVLPKNSLRNPVVEKILNQMVNVINTLIDTENDKLAADGKPRDFKFDEIRIELARELKKNAKEREDLTKAVNEGKIKHDKITKILQNEFGIKNPTRNDIIRYKLYQELKNNGYKTLYSNTYIEPHKLFDPLFNIEHIIPKAKLFDDSFSNKTLELADLNRLKADSTAFDFVENKFNSDLEKYELRVEALYNLGQKNSEEGISKAKYKKLLMRGADIGEGFIERDLRETQYIAKKAKEMLFEITRSVVSTSGQITDRLRDDWGLINVMKELNLPKYQEVGLTEFIEMKDGQKKEVIIDWTKRNDHRHHAMDALTVAFTKHNHIQYLNHLNARKDVNNKLNTNILTIEDNETHRVKDNLGNSKRIFNEPIPNFRHLAKEHLEAVLISHKAKNKVVTKNNNKIDGSKETQAMLTPRGQMHKETVYGKIRQYVTKEEKVSAKFDKETIAMVSNPKYKELLLKRLVENDNDPKKAFTGKNVLSKNPIILNPITNEFLPEKVKLIWLEDDFTIRKNITSELKIEKIIDEGVKRILQARLNTFGGDAKKAFSDLDQNPIWLNKEKGIAIKRVTISGVKNAEALHTKKDHLGNEILDSSGKPIPVDYVSTGNNHHVAIYEDENGNLQENVVSFFEAVERVNQGLSAIDKTYNQHEGWKFLFTMKQNEMFLFPNEKTGFNPQDIDLLDPKNKKIISPNMFRVQKFTIKDYFFRHHLETTVDDNSKTKKLTWRREGLSGLKGIIKVRINHLGEIIHLGEY